MKLRMRGDSLRLRLSRSETLAIGEGRAVRMSTRFPAPWPALVYAVDPSGAGPEPLAARFDAGEVRVVVHADEARRWARDEGAVTLQGEQALPDGGKLSVLVEKDFFCRSPRTLPEDERDLFPNPHGGACG